MGHSARTCEMNTLLCFEILRAGDPRDVGMWGRIILKWIVKECDVSLWAGFSWLGIISAGRSHDFGNVRSGCNSPLPAGKLSTSVSNWKLRIATERRFRFSYRSQYSSLYIVSHVLRQVAPITDKLYTERCPATLPFLRRTCKSSPWNRPRMLRREVKV